MTASDSDTVNTRPRRKKNFVGAPASGTAPAASSSTPSILTSAEVNASVSPARSWASYSEDEDDFPNEGSQARPVLGREARDRNSAVREAQEEQEPSYTDCMDTINATIAKVKNKANRTLNNGEEQAIFSAFQHMNKLYIRVLEENRKLRKRIDDHRCEQGGHPGPTRVVERMAPLPKPTYREALQGVASNTEKMADQPVVYISMTEEEDKTGKIKEIKTHIAGSKVEKIFSTKKGVAIRCHSDEDAGAVITSLQTKGLQGNRKPPLLPEVWLSYGTEDIRENDSSRSSIEATEVVGRLLDALESTTLGNAKVVIGMDSNAHHKSWGIMPHAVGGNTQAKTRGRALHDFITERSLVLRNIRSDPLTPTFISRKTDLESSDYPHHRTDWKKYKEATSRMLDSSWAYPPPGTRPEVAVATLLEHITLGLVEAAQAATPKKASRMDTERDTGGRKRRQGAKPRNCWWDAELREVRRKLNQVKRSPRATRDDIVAARRQYKALLRSKKTRAYHDFLDSLGNAESAEEVYKRIKTKNTTSCLVLLAGDACPASTCSRLADQYIGGTPATPRNMVQTEYRLTRSPDPHDNSTFLHDGVVSPISADEIERSLQAAQIDVKSAFCQVGHEAIVEGLRKAGAPKEILAFADDVTVMVAFKRKVKIPVVTIRGICEASLRDALRPTKLEMDPAKSQSLSSMGLQYERNSIEMKMLGVWITRSGSWKKHIIERVDKAKKIGFALARYARRSFGVKPSCIVDLYHRIMLPTVGFSIELWGPALANASYKRIVDQLGNLVLRVAFRLGKSFPQHLARTLASLEPTSVALTNIAVERYLHKETRLGPGNNVLQRKWEEELRARGLNLSARYERVGSIRAHDMGGAEVIIKEKSEAIKLEQSLREGVRVYTDGSRKDPDEAGTCSVGAAAIIYKHSNKEAHRFRLPPFATIYQAEQYAIIGALEALKKDKEVADGSRVLFFSDCRSVLQRILGGGGDHWSNRILEIASSMRVEGITCCFIWIPSHQQDGTIPGNEEADLEANRARLLELDGVVSDFPIPIAHTKGLLNNYARAQVVREAASISNPELRAMLSSRRQRGIVERQLRSYKDGSVLNLLAGHSKILRSYLAKIKPDAYDPLCQTCGVTHNLVHEDRPPWFVGGLGSVSITSARFRDFIKFLEVIVNKADSDNSQIAS
ncbi:hypothetical protein Pmar_PMAR011746 [Perkinsus marinus ATCC 50983]|uniref:RNase H type-1 domain-containing protein n=1 Tax=Perkinsus marinus (strain ATCC 50983 / TXsc) TaxID=423536 RepID=C5LCL7_PERM5|nr:hypothetical protein Pmar_PMAR011746 [Perkinsus marinus ATCC 50983]EER05700.1 hypothetical protein Pmar_PMAR011746 [Perkinsus marinus ATCC 50983]|eukprot:XP_002773884.1 hypothetical protein Pmar_PMAR011746 [Perkinsus marinus ATCC 50983]